MGNATVTGDAVKGCVWVVGPSGRVMALWYEGYWARFAPVRIYDKEGRQVWSELERRDIGGGFVTVYIDRIPKQCRTQAQGGRAWVVNPIDDE